MEAPEKIYVDSKAIGDNISTTVRTLPQDYPTCTEYTRTDAFIEKACGWIKDKGSKYIDIVNGQLELKKSIIKDFKNYMKGE